MDRDGRLAHEIVIRQRIQRSSASQLEPISSSERERTVALQLLEFILEEMSKAGYTIEGTNSWINARDTIKMKGVQETIDRQLKSLDNGTLSNMVSAEVDDGRCRWRCRGLWRRQRRWWRRQHRAMTMITTSDGNNYDNTNRHGGGIVIGVARHIG